MNYLLDTCVIFEVLKMKPGLRVSEWIRSINEENLFLSVATIGEIQKGSILVLPIEDMEIQACSRPHACWHNNYTPQQR